MTMRVGKGSCIFCFNKNVGQHGDHDDQQEGYHGNCDEQNDRGINHRRFDLSFDLRELFHISGEPPENGIQNTACLSGGHHIAIKIVKDLGVFLERIGKGCPAFHIGPDLVYGLLKRFVFRLAAEDIKTLHERQSRVDHGRQLPGKDHDIFIR